MDTVIRGAREIQPQLHYRRLELKFREDAKDPNRVSVVASTDDLCDMGWYREQLRHGSDNVDVTPAVSVLFNHDRNQVIGKIVATQIDGRQMSAELEIDPEVTGSNGLKLLRAIKQGYLRGVSIGYEYRREDCIINEDDSGKRTVIVNRWTLREISITPTQADVAASVVRSVPDWAKQAFAKANLEESDMNFEQWLAARGLKSEDLTEGARARLRAEFDAEQRAKATLDTAHKNELQAEKERANKAEREAAELKLRAEVEALCRSHEVEYKEGDFAGKDRAACLALILERKAQKEASAKNPKGTTVAIEVGTDAFDKARESVVDALLARAGITVKAERLQGNPFVGRRCLELAKRFAIMAGVRGVEDWNDQIAGNYIMGRGQFARAANVSSGMFDTYVLANVMDKAVALGFSAFGMNATYPKWTRTRQVADFKTVNGAALDVGNLVKTVENHPFPEMTKAEFGYTAALEMWGVTASLTLQTLINDDLGEFMAQIFRSGQIANRTIEKEVYAQLEAATWTNNTTGSAGLGSAGTPTPHLLDLPRKDFINKTGPSGEKLGNVPKFLIHTPDIAVYVDIALGRVINYGGIAQGSTRAGSVEAIETPYLTGTSTTYYLAADPNLADTLVLLMLNGILTPQIEEYDPGAVASRKWKIFLPFKAKPVITSVDLAAGGTAYVAPGLQQATA